jgi:ATP-binding cassette subfamily B (MDR/TAP) protein 1
MESMKTNHVWDLVNLLSRWRSIENKWVLKIKHKVDGSFECYKARLVAKSYTQEERIDYEDIFSPIMRITSVCFILAIVTYLDLELYQMDARTAFLNRELNE